MEDEEFDDFLQEATLSVRELWEAETGKPLTSEQIYKLNDLLDNFFTTVNLG